MRKIRKVPRKRPRKIWLSLVFAHFYLNVLRADKGTGGCTKVSRVCFVQGSPQYPYPPAQEILRSYGNLRKPTGNLRGTYVAARRWRQEPTGVPVGPSPVGLP